MKLLKSLQRFQGYIGVFGSSIIAVVILQLLIFPKIFHDYSTIYAEFMKDFYNYSIASIVLNTIAIYQNVKFKNNYILFYLFYLFYALILYFSTNNIHIIFFALSIYIFEIVKSILRVQKNDLLVGIIFPLQMLLIYIFLNKNTPYLVYGYINIILSLPLLIYYKMLTIKIIKIQIQKFFIASLEIIVNILNKDLDKILILNFLAVKDNNILTFIVVFGLMLMPIQLLGKYLVTDTQYNAVFNLSKIIKFTVILSFFSSLVSLYLIDMLYHIDALPYIDIIIYIILAKIVYSIGYLQFSKQVTDTPILFILYKIIILIGLCMILYFLNASAQFILISYLVYLIIFYSFDYLVLRGNKK